MHKNNIFVTQIESRQPSDFNNFRIDIKKCGPVVDLIVMDVQFSFSNEN